MNRKIIGIDLGGTSAKFAILNEEGQIQVKWSVPTDIRHNGSKIVPDLIQSIRHHLELYQMDLDDFLGIGMGSPGMIDYEKGTVVGAYNLNWSEVQFVRQQFEEAFNLPFFIENDANVAALGEQWQGAGEKADNMVFVTLGTGVGGGLITDGHLLHGCQGAAGEIGHITIIEDGYDCTCGKSGCLETVASATGIVRVARDLSEQFAGDSALKCMIDDGQDINAKIVFDSAKAGDHFANIVVDHVVNYLALALGNVANLLNPSVIVLGGGVSHAGEFLTHKVQEKVKEYVFLTIRDTIKVRQAILGNDAGVVGAASLVINDRK
ncbi:ROK family glucokinase [Allofustis seminis]|uniref:ROK family glucokinase n=1 Tax=Allofustis seminis TaxID=166939 RepID=UPI000369FE8D|nr:ROK family glucokinase [Allofustis seminis]